uniref:Ribokinase n=1 Tax=Cacopsylla melanoneura TaxID=428564 RepID=A0A8D8SS68_9HEMI
MSSTSSELQNGNDKKTDIVVVGSCMIDLVSYVPRLPMPGETIHGTKFQQGFGGKGANQCVAAAKLGASTALVAKLGGDNFGACYLSELNQYDNLNTRYVTREEISSGMASISVSSNGENQIVIVPGANSTLCNSDIDAALPLLRNSKVVVFQGETPWSTTRYCLDKMVHTEVLSILNVAPAPSIPCSDLITSLTLASIVCVNEVEAELLTQIKLDSEEHISDSLDSLFSLGCKTVIITLGANGAVFATSKSRTVEKVQVKKVDHPVDTTGAGDCFLGALAYFISYFPSLPLGEQISRACKIARLSVMQCGTQPSFPSLSLLEFLDESLLSIK